MRSSRNRDWEAYNELIRRYQKPIYTLAYTLIPDDKHRTIESFREIQSSSWKIPLLRSSFYVGKIDAFARANAESKANREKVASILRRYKDSSATTAK